ncbi:LOW QUALITY PROTEIN: intraflagellar transport protein 46 homolog, partial [Menidia menidia]
MERAAPGRGPRLLKNQPYDESLEVLDGEEVASVHSPTPRGAPQIEPGRRPRIRSLMSANSSSDEEPPPRAREGGPPGGAGGGPGGGGGAEEEQEEEEEEEEEEEDSEEGDSEDSEAPPGAPEGAYDPADYASLPVSTELRELFQYITRYSPQSVELEHQLKPFIPDFIPAVGDIDAFLKVPRPDGKADHLGLLVLDEPSVKQSDPTVLTLWLSEESKTHGATELQRVPSLPPQALPRALTGWVSSVAALQRARPPACVRYGAPPPDIDSLMQEWPAELEELL